MPVTMDESWADAPTNFTLSNGDLTVTMDVAPWRGIIATAGWSTGKYYWEVTVGNQANILSSYSQSIGICLTTHTKTSFMGSLNGFGYAGHPVLINNTGDIFRQNTQNDPIGPFTTYIEDDILGFALDMDNNKLFLHLNGVYQNSGNPVAGTGAIYDSIPAGTWYPSCSLIAVASVVTYNFGAAGPSYSIPTGYTMPDYVPPVTIGVGGVSMKKVIIGG